MEQSRYFLREKFRDCCVAKSASGNDKSEG